MRNSPLYICDDDPEYLEKLSGYIMKKAYSPFIVKTICGADHLEMDNLKEGICVISSSLLREDMLQSLDAQRTIILNEGELKREFAHFKAINKFQSAAAIYEQLLQCQMDREDVVPVESPGAGNRTLQVNGVYSPIKRIGKSAFTEKMCVESSDGRKVLYLNMEEVSKGIEEGTGLSEVIYFYKQNRLQLMFEMPDVIRHGQYYDYILPVRCAFDIKDMTAAEWVDLVDQIEKAGIYDCLWIDFDGIPTGPELFEKCEKIYVPYISQEDECRRIEHFEQMLRMMPDDGISEKVVKILIGDGQN